MQPVDLTPAPAPAPPAPSRFATTVGAIGRAGGRAVQIGVLVAAGVCGWFAVEHYAFPPLAGDVSAPLTSRLWPAALTQHATTWDTYNFSVDDENGVLALTTNTDASSGITRVVVHEGGVSTEVEIAGFEAWERPVGSPDWQPVLGERVAAFVLLGPGESTPYHLTDVLNENVAPYASVTQEPSDDSNVRFRVRVDLAAYRSSDVVEYARWAEFEGGLNSDDAFDLDTLDWVLDVRADGYVVKWKNHAGFVATWSDIEPGISFESPLAGG